MTIIGIHEPKNQRTPTLLGLLLKCSLILFNLALNSNLESRVYGFRFVGV